MIEHARQLKVLGVDVTDLSMEEAIELIRQRLAVQGGPTRSVFFVNAATLNVAHEDPGYRRLLGGADYVFGDGTGVRWAARWLHGARLRGNVNGTDLVPRLLRELGGQGLRYFLLGNTEDAIGRSAAHAREAFPGWTLAGHHHGYVDNEDCESVVDQINAAEPHMLLVGMGNPKQERWIIANRTRLRVPLCLGIGGLLTYWSGDLVRAPGWMRKLGMEWVHLLLRQPHKFRRYVLGNPLFLLRVARSERPAGAVGVPEEQRKAS